MEAMFMTTNTAFRFSKPFLNTPSLSLPKPSTVLFASNHSHWRNAVERTKYTSYVSSTKTRRDEIVVRAAIDDVKKFAEDANEKVKEAADYVVDKTKEGVETTTEKTEEAVESGKEVLKNAGEATKDEAEKISKKLGFSGNQGIDGSWGVK